MFNEKDYINEIINGEALSVLKQLPDEFVDAVVTSPPYWSLRKYGDIKSVFGGDIECEHEWGESLLRKSSGGEEGSNSSVSLKTLKSSHFETESNYCLRCGAWFGQLGLEQTYQIFISHLISIFKEAKRVLKKTGTCWVVIGDSFIGNGVSRHRGYSDPKKQKIGEISYDEPSAMKQTIPPKCLGMIPSRFAIEMCEKGWILRSEIIWRKPNATPESCKDRFTVNFEKIFMFSKQQKYYFKQQFEKHKTFENRPFGVVRNREYGYQGKFKVTKRSKKVGKGSSLQLSGRGDVYGEKGKNRRAVWDINTRPSSLPHMAIYPEELVEIMLNAGCPETGIVLDPFMGSGTTGVVALKQNKKFIGIELNESYVSIAKNRLEPYFEQEKLPV